MQLIPPRRLVLASASPARLRTLQAAGLDAEVIVSGVDESTVDSARADVLCGTLARLKAQTVVTRLRRLDPTGGLPAAGQRLDRTTAHDETGQTQHESGQAQDESSQPEEANGQQRDEASGQHTDGAIVLGCDSVLAFDGEIFGKPADVAEAVARWQRMRGRSGVLHTGHCLVDVGTGRVAEQVAATTVRFADITDAEIAAYVGTGEPLQVAGAFTIDGLGGAFVEGIEGDPGTVVGLSLPLLRRLLAELGVEITSLWRPTAVMPVG